MQISAKPSMMNASLDLEKAQPMSHQH